MTVSGTCDVSYPRPARRVIAFGGRVLDDALPKYLNSPETDIFHKGRQLFGLYEAQQNNRELSRILVVEGYMDVVARHSSVLIMR